MSTLKNLSDSELASRKTTLESTLFGCSMAGVEIPKDDMNALQELQSEFARRGLLSTSRRGWAIFIGRVVGDYQIESFHSENRYSFTFKAKCVSTGVSVLLTLAQDAVAGSFAANEDQLQRLLAFEFSLKDNTQAEAKELHPRQVIENYIYRTNAYRNDSTLQIIASGNYDNLPYFVVNDLPVIDLRSQLKNSTQLIAGLKSVAEALLKVSAENRNWYHGNLSPDSISFSGNKVLLRDPGYFGQVKERHAPAKQILQTTLLYYPDIESTDLQALGLILAESLLGVSALESVFAISFKSEKPDTTISESEFQRLDPILQTIRAANLKGHWRGFVTLALDLVDQPATLKTLCAGLLGINELKKSQLRNIGTITTFEEAISAFSKCA